MFVMGRGQLFSYWILTHWNKRDITKATSDMNVGENGLTNNFVSRKRKYFGHAKHQSSLGRAVTEGMVPGRRGGHRTLKTL